MSSGSSVRKHDGQGFATGGPKQRRWSFHRAHLKGAAAMERAHTSYSSSEPERHLGHGGSAHMCKCTHLKVDKGFMKT